MLHGLTRHSCTRLLKLLQSQLEKAVEVMEIVKDIPEDVEELEKTLQVMHFLAHKQPTEVSDFSWILQQLNFPVKGYQL